MNKQGGGICQIVKITEHYCSLISIGYWSEQMLKLYLIFFIHLSCVSLPEKHSCFGIQTRFFFTLTMSFIYVSQSYD